MVQLMGTGDGKIVFGKLFAKLAFFLAAGRCSWRQDPSWSHSICGLLKCIDDGGNNENDDGYDDGVRNKSEASSSSGDRRAPFFIHSLCSEAVYFDGSWWEVPLKVQSYFQPFQRDLERPLWHLGGIQNKSIMVVRDAYCLGVDATDCIYKVWLHCESKCLSPDDTVEKMHRAVFPQCELPNVCSDVQLGWMTFHILCNYIDIS